MNRGEVITVSDLNKRFSNLYRKINNLSSSDFSAMSTGQLFISASGINSEVLSVSLEQFFDTMRVISYTAYEDWTNPNGPAHVEPHFLQSILDEIERLEE